MAASSPAAAKTLFRISTENTPQHHQTALLERFATAVRERAGDGFEVRFAHSATMFRDRDVVDAMFRGQLEMAIPGAWQLERFVPDLGVFMLPMFYGRDSDVTHAVLDGDLGRLLDSAMESELGSHVLGRWLDLGFTHLYAKRPIITHRDIRGLHVRVAGGAANVARLVALGGQAVIIPWPDLPQALADRAVDGVLSSHASIASASLWTEGLVFAYEDRQYFAQYVPLVSARFWKGLPRDLQGILTKAWDEVASEGRMVAVRAQEEARRTLVEAGVRIVVPSENDIIEARAFLMPVQPALVAQLGIDSDLVARIEKALRRAP